MGYPPCLGMLPRLSEFPRICKVPMNLFGGTMTTWLKNVVFQPGWQGISFQFWMFHFLVLLPKYFSIFWAVKSRSDNKRRCLGTRRCILLGEKRLRASRCRIWFSEFTKEYTVVPIHCELIMWYTKAISNWPYHGVLSSQCKWCQHPVPTGQSKPEK